MSKTLIPLSAPTLRGRELRYLTDAVRSTWVSSAGPYVSRFEKALVRRQRGGHAVAVASGTAALHIGLLLAGVKPGDLVLVPDLTFVATANTVVYCGARPVLVDVEPVTGTLDVTLVKDFFEKECENKNGALIHRGSNRRVSAVVPVHVLGHPVDMDPLLSVARRFGVAVVEDACEALGALYKGKPVGLLGDVAAFSFNGNKVITTGGGGMVLTANEKWAVRARYLTTQAKDDPSEYIHNEVGYNYRMSGLQAAVGCAQMEQLPLFLKKKAAIHKRYATAFASHPRLTLMPALEWARSTFWLSTVRLKDAAPHEGARLVDALKARGIEARRLWRPMHLLPMHAQDIFWGKGVSSRLYDEAVSLPSSAGLMESDQQKVIRAVRDHLSQ